MNTNQFKEVDERFDNEKFDAGNFCSCYEGDIYDAFPEGKEKILTFLHTELLNERKRVLEEVLEAIDERIIKLSEFKGRIHTTKEAHAVYELLEIKASITKQLEKSP